MFDSEELHALRDENIFRKFGYPEHQKKLSPLCKLDIPIVSIFILDYMHVVCLGVTKRILYFLTSGPLECRLSYRLREMLSITIASYNGTLPSEFAHQPRSLKELKRWKATEFRMFLLYIGPIVLKSVLSSDVFLHFLCLHVAMSILLQTDNQIRKTYLDFASQLLHFFAKQSSHFYTPTFAVYNVHSLTHLHQDVANMQCSLNSISAFPFENFLQHLKQSIKDSRNPIVQAARRKQEFELSHPNIVNKKNKYKYSTRLGDSCFLMQNKKICILKEMVDEKTFRCTVLNLKNMESLYDKPIDSKVLSIAFIVDMEKIKKTEKIVPTSDFVRKVLMLPHKTGYAIFPVLHELEKHL